MSRILDQKNFRWTPSWRTNVIETLKKHGFKKTTLEERAKRLAAAPDEADLPPGSRCASRSSTAARMKSLDQLLKKHGL